MEKSLVQLQSPRVTVIIRCLPFPELIYWGRSLAHGDASMVAALDRPIPNSRIDEDAPVSLSPENGRGLFSVPVLEGHRQGPDWSPVFTTRTYQHAGQTLTIVCEDPHARLTLRIELTLCKETGVLRTRQLLANGGEEDYWVNRLAVTLTLPDRAREVMAFHGRWISEFRRHRLNPAHGGFVQENRRGRTSHEYFPALVIGQPGFSEQQGELWGLHLAWSGNHRLRADCKSDGRRQVQAEALYFPGEIVLAPDESLSTPWVYATWSGEGLNGMSAAFHRYLRHSRLPAAVASPRPVHLNTWEGIYFDHQTDYIEQMAQRAAALGVERFIIDDGWFRGRNSDTTALGDWYTDPEKYPQGLTPVIDAVKRTGMQFGIWVEPEMISQDSSLFRKHPDWVLGLASYPRPLGRNQWVLDLCNEAVYRYLLARLSWLLGEHDIRYVKWDFNREVVQPAHGGQASMTRQTRQMYRLFDELNQRFGQVEFESCASGGGRMDYAMLKRCCRFWPSDSNDALDRQQIQRGASYFFPPEVLGTHIGDSSCHATGRRHTLQFRALTALFGHMGIELDPVRADAEQQAGFAHYIALYKQLRPLLHHGRAFRIDAEQPGQLIHGVVAEDASTAVVLISQPTLPEYALCGQLRVPGLTTARRYRVKVWDKPDSLCQPRNSAMKRYPAWLTQTLTLSGEWLAEVGLAMPVLEPESALLLGFIAE